MAYSQAAAHQAWTDPSTDFDAIIIGAGVSGLYQLYKLRELGSRCGCSKPAPASAAPGTGTAIPAHASIRRAGPMATPFRRNSWRNGTGRSISLVNPRPSAI